MKRKKLQDLGKKINQFHQEIYQELHDIRIETQSEIDVAIQVDTAYFMKEIDNHLAEIGKQVRDIGNLSQKLAFLICSQTNAEVPIRTDYCTATPKVKMAVSIPHHKKDPEGYAELMQWLGVPEKQWQGEEPTVSLRWNGIIEAVSKAAEEGRPLPKSIDVKKTHPQYSLTMRRRLDIAEDIPEEEDVF